MDPAARQHHHMDLPGVLAEFALLVGGQHTAADVLERLGQYVTELLPVHGVGLLLRGLEGDLEVATANTEAGAVVESLESELGEGPCASAMLEGAVVAVPDLADARDRWPRFVPRALEAGVRAIHAIPLTLRTGHLGSLDLVSLEPCALSAEELAAAQMLGDVAVAYLANSRALEDSSRLAQQLSHALDSRVVVEQAKGVLAERLGCSVDEAFEVLRRHARRHQTKLQQVAERVVAGELRLER
jgi:GAF domain-containing protein